jgi:hypothetical protein
VPGPPSFGGGFQFPLGRLRNNPLWFTGFDGRQRAHWPSSAARACGSYTGNYLRKLLALRHQFLDLMINAGYRHLDMLRGIAAS